MPIDPDTGLKYILGGGSGIGILALLWRFVSKSLRIDKQETAQNDADINVYKKLQEEIDRLGRLVHKLDNRIKNLDSQLTQLRNLELEAAQDFGALSMVVLNMPCHSCPTQGAGLQQLKDIVERMTARRNAKMAVFAAAAKSNMGVDNGSTED